MKLPILLTLALLPCAAIATEPQASTTPAPAPTHVMVKGATLQWGAAPPSLPPGAQAAVLFGDPGQPGLFVIRLKGPPGYRVPRHWHPTDEHVTVIEGDATLAMDQGAQAHSETFAPGDYVLLPAQMQHEASTKGGMVVQIQAMGPFEINYVDPKDDPRKQMPADAVKEKKQE
jgi:quercetin dioxygenase-like cupin family protein